MLSLIQSQYANRLCTHLATDPVGSLSVGIVHPLFECILKPLGVTLVAISDVVQPAEGNVSLTSLLLVRLLAAKHGEEYIYINSAKVR